MSSSLLLSSSGSALGRSSSEAGGGAGPTTIRLFLASTPSAGRDSAFRGTAASSFAPRFLLARICGGIGGPTICSSIVVCCRLFIPVDNRRGLQIPAAVRQFYASPAHILGQSSVQPETCSLAHMIFLHPSNTAYYATLSPAGP